MHDAADRSVSETSEVWRRCKEGDARQSSVAPSPGAVSCRGDASAQALHARGGDVGRAVRRRMRAVGAEPFEARLGALPARGRRPGYLRAVAVLPPPRVRASLVAGPPGMLRVPAVVD